MTDITQQGIHITLSNHVRQIAEMQELDDIMMVMALAPLRRKLVAIQGEGAQKRDLVGVVDLNIQEFQDLMASARRSFLCAWCRKL